MSSMPPSQHSGELLDGRYQVGPEIGRGGHGIVFRGHDQVAGRDVAIKFLHPELSADPEFNVRILREAKVAKQLSGTAAIEIYALRSDPHGSIFMVMELLDGADLDALLGNHERGGKHFPLEHVAPIFEPIVQTLELAHSMGIVHRDLKPGNVYVQRGDRGVRLLDWGLVKVMKANPLTRAGMVAGSPSYIAPEVWKGDPTKLDHRIDIYSLAAMLYRVLAGKPPFTGNLLELMQASLTAQRPSLHAIRPEFPAEIDQWVAQALAIDPGQRFAKVTGMWQALRSIIAL